MHAARRQSGVTPKACLGGLEQIPEHAAKPDEAVRVAGRRDIAHHRLDRFGGGYRP